MSNLGLIMTTKPSRKTTDHSSTSPAKKAVPAPLPTPASAYEDATGKAVAIKHTKKPPETPAAACSEAAVDSAAIILEHPVPVAASRPERGELAKIIALLKREGGVSLTDLRDTASWQAHSVRGAISTLKKQLGGSLHCTIDVDSLRVYCLEVK